jgi:hypothetical protein
MLTAETLPTKPRGDSSSSPHNDDPPSSSIPVNADVDFDVFRSTNSSSLEPESGDSTCKEAEAGSDLFKSTPSSIMDYGAGVRGR